MGNGDPKGLYAILGVGTDADIAAIKAAYRRRAMELHPDRNASHDATRQFQAVNEAYAILADPVARAEYDSISVDTAESSTTASREQPEPIVCSCCNKVTAQPRYAIFLEAKSFLVVTTRSVVQGIFCSACAEKKALKASLITWVLGWWGIPWGPIYSIQSLWVNMLGGKRPALANAQLATHQAWYFASVGNLEMARVIAVDAMALAKKIPRGNKEHRNKTALGYDVEDEGEKLRAQIQGLLDALGGNGGRLLKNAWGGLRRPFFVQAGLAAAVAISLCVAIANEPTSSYTPPRGPKPYSIETVAQDNSRQQPHVASPTQNSAQREAVRQPWEASYSAGGNTETVPTSKPVWVKPVASPNGSPWPTVPSYVSGFPRNNSGGLSTVTIDNGQNDSDVFVKLVSLEGPTARPVRMVFIPAHGRFTIESLIAGPYDVRHQNLNTGALSRSEQFMLEEQKTYDGTQYSAITLTLYRVRNGNMHTYPLAQDEF